MIWNETGGRDESFYKGFLNDEKEDVVVKLGLFVGLYCGGDDTWITKKRLYQRKN